MVAKLITRSSAGDVAEYELTGEIATLGRGSDNTILINDPTVSGKHAQIIISRDRFFIEDLGSTTGTHVNGKLVGSAALEDGDEISLGDVRLIFQDSSSDARHGEMRRPVAHRGELLSGGGGGISSTRLPVADPEFSIRAQVMEISEYLSILAKQKAFVLVFTLSAILTALTLTYVASEKYEATTTIFYRPIEVMRLKTQEATAFGSPVPSAAFTVIGKTIEELLQSELILDRVVKHLKLDVEVEEDYSDEPWYIYYYKATEEYLKEAANTIWAYLQFGRLIEGDKRVGAITTLASNISIEIDDSYISFIKVRDKNNLRAAATVDTLAAELVIWLKEKERGPLKKRKTQLIDALDEKQIEIDTYRGMLLGLLRENNVSSFVHELEQGNIRLSQLETARIDALATIRNQETELDTITVMLQQHNNRSGPGGESIQADDFKRLTSDAISLKVGLEGSQARYKALEVEIFELKERLTNLSQLDIEYKRIDGDLNTASRDHLLIKDALQEVIVREYSIDSEIGILHQATVPLEPVSPIKIYHVMLAAVLGLVVSVGLVYVLTFFNIRILFPSEGVKGRKSPAGADSADQ